MSTPGVTGNCCPNIESLSVVKSFHKITEILINLEIKKVENNSKTIILAHGIKFIIYNEFNKSLCYKSLWLPKMRRPRLIISGNAYCCNVHKNYALLVLEEVNQTLDKRCFVPLGC